MSRHLADRSAPGSGTRVKEFLRIARTRRETLVEGGWHRRDEAPGPDTTRLKQFLRIARGRLA
ncbi:hypothetical protein [Pseudogemmobacter sonorensis]|uniref:hypothetical protein n=1 Tax=Pseudogemmobacter sonorensis TaxID=2989681 RepID=UPI00369E2B89